jgi:phosphatidylserine/phosphatidylglycerophosphate/cardiolipin synthase-like enzyme
LAAWCRGAGVSARLDPQEANVGTRDPIFLIDGAQAIDRVADALAAFIHSAKRSVHIAIYDFRLKDAGVAKKIIGALNEQAEKGVEVQIAYDHRNAPKFGPGDDPAPHGTHKFLQEKFPEDSAVKLQPVDSLSGEATEAIAGSKLMHSKYVIVDGHTDQAAVWMGSTNFTDDAWTHQDNNILVLDSPSLSAFYETDFNELWANGDIAGTGVNDFGTITRDGLNVDVAFSPGEGRRIDKEIAELIADAQESVHIASMVITSNTILDALTGILEAGRVPVRGVFDGPEMHTSEAQMEKSTGKASATKVAQIEQLRKVLVEKKSRPFDPHHPNALHNFMHNKLVVVDDALVTGSHNFSLSAEHNAENAILLRDPKLAEKYRAYVEQLVEKYGSSRNADSG